jgi:hypothetical protein
MYGTPRAQGCAGAAYVRDENNPIENLPLPLQLPLKKGGLLFPVSQEWEAPSPLLEGITGGYQDELVAVLKIP